MAMDIKQLPDPSSRYVLDKALGSGIFGQVYEATDKEASGKKVAIKIQPITEDTEANLLDEYGILKDFCPSHTNLVDFYGVFCDRSESIAKIWFVMEFCEGGPVIDLVRGLQSVDKKMSEEHIAFILKETIKALIYLHEQNVIHRDVRASNILLTKEGEVKLSDFGLSCRLSNNLAKRSTMIGSPSWMAPEIVIGGDASYGNRADVWALGITAIELADGKAPFQDIHPTRALFQIVRNPPPGLSRPSMWSNDLVDFISECLEKNPEHRPFSMELIEHPYIQSVPDNDYHLTRELKVLAYDFGMEGKKIRMPERLIRNGLLQTETNPEPEPMYVEDLAALENLSEEFILEELRHKMSKKSYQTFVGDILLILNPSCDTGLYNETVRAKYRFKSRSDNEPHIYAVADSAYQDAFHHDEPEFILFSGESYSGKTTNMIHAMNHLIYLGQVPDAGGHRIEKAMKILQVCISAATPTNPNSTRCILQTQITYGKSGKLSGAIFWLYQLEKWRMSSTDMTQSNFNLVYYFYDGLEAAGRLAEFSLEPERKYRYLRIPDALAKVKSARDDPQGNVERFREIEQYMRDLEFEEQELNAMYRMLAAILILGNVRFKDSNSGAAEVENPDEAVKVATLLGLDESKFSWALINYCLIEKGTAVKRRHSTDEARDARDVLAGTLYRRLIDWVMNSINQKLSFSRSVFGDKFAVSLLDTFGFECFHRNRLEQLIVNTMNEQLQFLYNQRLFSWEMQEQEEEQVPVISLHFYDNKIALDQLMARPLGLFYILDEACRTSGGQEYIMSTIKNSSKGPYVKLSGSHEFSVAHFAGKINYDARDLADKNRDFLPPEMIETLRASNDSLVRHCFTNKLTKSGSLTAPSTKPAATNKKEKEAEGHKMRKYNTESKGQYSQVHRMRTAASTFRSTSLELLKSLSVSGGIHFVRCVRASLTNEAYGFQSEVIRQQLRALSVLDTAKARQLGYPTRIPFAEFLKRYKFLAFDFDENVEISKDNCRLLLIRLKMEGWVIGKSKVFLRYYNVEYLSRLYETQVKKIIRVQCMMRAFLARRRIEKSKVEKVANDKRRAVKDMSEEDAAVKIQKVFRGFAVRKAYGPLINRHTGKLDEETAEFLRRYTTIWRSKTIFQVLLQYRAVRYQDLVNFSQQVHIYNQAVMQGLMNTSTGVILDRVDPQSKALEFLGPPQLAVWKLPFRVADLPYFDTTYMCDPSLQCSDTLAVAYDSDPDTWDEPLKRRAHAASHHIRNSVQNAHNEHEALQQCDKPTQDLINSPYCRDPSQSIKRIPSDPGQRPLMNYSPTPYNRQSYGNIKQQAWHDESPSRPAVYKKKHAPPTPTNKNKTTARNDEDWQFPRLTPTKHDKNKNKYGGSMPSDINNPIKELQQLARTRSKDSVDDDEPPFNFQAMLRKTPRNRESMKRSGETSSLAIFDSGSTPVLNNNAYPRTSTTPEDLGKKSPIRPKSSQEFKRLDSVERFKMAIRRTDSSQSFKSCITNGNVGETVQLAPGIVVEGYVVDL